MVAKGVGYESDSVGPDSSEGNLVVTASIGE